MRMWWGKFGQEGWFPFDWREGMWALDMASHLLDFLCLSIISHPCQASCVWKALCHRNLLMLMGEEVDMPLWWKQGQSEFRTHCRVKASKRGSRGFKSWNEHSSRVCVHRVHLCVECSPVYAVAPVGRAEAISQFTLFEKGLSVVSPPYYTRALLAFLCFPSPRGSMGSIQVLVVYLALM